MATYKHGVYTSEQATSMTAPVTGTAGLQVVVGTAPVNMLEHPEQAVNTPLLAYNYKEAVAAVGYHDDFAAYGKSKHYGPHEDQGIGRLPRVQGL